MLFLIYPFGISRFFLRGLFFPLSLGLVLQLKQIKIKAYQTLAAMILVTIILVSGIFPHTRRIQAVLENNPWYYQPAELIQAYNFLDSAETGGILTGYLNGNYLPAKTGKSVFFGHFLQTPDADQKYLQLKKYYGGQLSEEDAKRFLVDNNISHILYGEEEKELGGHVYAATNLCYKSGKVEIYCTL